MYLALLQHQDDGSSSSLMMHTTMANTDMTLQEMVTKPDSQQGMLRASQTQLAWVILCMPRSCCGIPWVL